MSRPYFTKRITELVRILEGAGNDPRILHDLIGELKHRRTPSAVALRRRVEAALGTLARQRADSKAKAESCEPPRQGTTTALASDDPLPYGAAQRRSERLRAKPPGSSPGDGETRQKDQEQDRPPGAGFEEPETPEFTFTATPSPPELIPAPDADSLLAAWLTLEVLEPQPLPRAEELEHLGRRLIRAGEQPEPWKVHGDLQGRERGVYWFVYLGELDLSAAVTSLLQLFPDDSPERPGRIKGTTTMAVVVLDSEGRPADGKVFISSFAWGYGRVRTGELKTLSEFPEEERRLCQEIRRRMIRMNEEGEILPVTHDDLRRVTDWLLGRLGLPGEQISRELVYVRVPIRRRVYEAPEPELLNSFFLEDLERTRTAFRSGDIGPSLAGLMSGRSTQARVDVARNQAALDEALAPTFIPLSRWPGWGRHPLVLMQQAAVNHASRELAVSGLVGINGPPGTGKTTLLRDVVAKVVLDRSIAMVAFDDPLTAFSHVGSMSNRGVHTHLYKLDESLLGHEVLVASSNNKAVENVSRELPAVDAIADDFEPPLRYFASISDAVAQGDRRAEVEEGRTWGLAAGVLGNAANRANFVDSFWWHPARGMQYYLRGIVDGWDPKAFQNPRGEGPEPPPEVLLLEDAPTDREQALSRWQKARSRFLKAWRRADSRRESLKKVRAALHDRTRVEQELAASRANIASQEAAVETLRGVVKATAGLLELHRRRHRDAVADREATLVLRPGFFARLFGTRRFREWRDAMTERVAAVDAARRDERLAEERAGKARLDLGAAENQLQRLEAAEVDFEHGLAKIRETLTAARSELGERLPDRFFWSRPEEERQKLSPWLGIDFRFERDELFAACFDLHRAFIGAAARPLSHNLGAAMRLLKGRKLSEKQEPARRSIWASLFLAVPVISTTFASVSRMFGPLGREQLGWLLIDEAGQAVPQAAVGAMWRSQRVIAIGDPQQVPPVVAMPQRLIDAVFAEYGIDPEAWSAPRISLQSLADRASWFGTTLLPADGDLWVGSPLRVHRRCDEPMFGICNRIAYDSQMVQATPHAQSEIGVILGESGWYDVASEDAGHWSPSEGEVAADLLSRLLESCPELPRIFFITPFRLVKFQLRKRLRRVFGRYREAGAWSWVQESVDTIHGFQGRQAEAVILVLGAPSPQAAGARRWAGAEPNLLNVACSRAQRRLYVVGSRQSWQDAGVFRNLASILPVKLHPVEPPGR